MEAVPRVVVREQLGPDVCVCAQEGNLQLLAHGKGPRTWLFKNLCPYASVRKSMAFSLAYSPVGSAM